MTHYFDTSAAVPAFVREPATDRILAFLTRLPAGDVAISLWTMTKFASALALKTRTGAIDGETVMAASAEWVHFAAAARMIDIVDRHFEQASLFCQRRDLALRAGDALHLAIASRAGCTLVTLDERMAKAAPELGVPVAEI